MGGDAADRSLKSRTMLNTTIALVVTAAVASLIDAGGIMLWIALPAVWESTV
jgi:hypothetical protein